MVANATGQVVSVDYMMDEKGQLGLEFDTLKIRTATIVGWPHGIRTALESLRAH